MAMKTLSALSTADMLAEIRRRQKSSAKLKKLHASLLLKIKKVEKQLAEIGVDNAAAKSVASGKGRVKNSLTLQDAMIKVMSKEKPMSVAEIADGVEKIGYVSTSKTFKTIIFQTLGKEKKLFRKEARGQYALR